MALTEQNKQALLVGGILGGAIFIIIVYFMVMTILPKVGNMKADAAKLTTQKIANQKTLKGYKEYLSDKEKSQKIEDAFQIVQQRLPSNQDPIEVFDLLRGYFEGTDVQFTYIEPGTEQNRGRFREYPFVIKGSARYHEFGQLINLIECNPDRLMRVTSFRLVNNSKRPSIHPMEVGISTFTFNDVN
jgi:Tfp pilus assembly protein PilO